MTPWIVVGGGYWGACIARALRQREIKVLLLDSRESGAASKAAAGLVRSIPDYVRPNWWGPEHEAACQTFWQGDDFVHYPEQLFHQQQPEPEFKRNVYCLKSQSEIACPEVLRQKVLSISTTKTGWTAETDQGPLAAAGVILAAGVWTDRILQASGLPVIHVASWPGRGAIHTIQAVSKFKNPNIEGRSAQVQSPAQVLTWAYRLDGDTRTRRVSAIPWRQQDFYLTEGVAEPLLDRLALGPAKTQLFGYRPRLRRWEVQQIAPRCIVATGGNRSGLAGAAGIALQVANLVTNQS